MKEISKNLFIAIHNFGEIAEKVHESSKVRKSHSESAILYIDKSMEISGKLHNKIESIAAINLELRDQHNLFLHTSIILNTNLEFHNNLIRELCEKGVITQESSDLMTKKVNELSKSINKVQPILYQLLEIDNRIILMDSLVIRRKEIQINRLKDLKRLTENVMEDSENAIQGSALNISRSIKFKEQAKSAETVFDLKMQNNIQTSINEANEGWNTASKVNVASVSQLEFAEKVKGLYEDAIAIKELIISEHNFFDRNIVIIDKLQEILNKDFRDFLDISGTVEKIEHDIYTHLSLVISINNFKSYNIIACQDIENISKLNYNMSDKITMNSDLENQTVVMTQEELLYYDEINKDVEHMTEATTFPIEGSAKNIENGKIIEKEFINILKEMVNENSTNR